MPSVRAVTPAEVPTLLRFIRELATYERVPDAVVATEALLHDLLFGPDAVAHAVFVEEAGVPQGFALYYFTVSSCLGRPGLYLKDLYVTAEARGRGLGKQLLTYLARLAVDRGYGRMEWAVHNRNEPAIQFYRAAGARPLDEQTVYRLTGDALTTLAQE